MVPKNWLLAQNDSIWPKISDQKWSEMALDQNWTKKDSHLNWSIHVWSHPQLCDAAYTINLTATAAMAGGTQLVEGAHLTGGNTCFCRESNKCRDHAGFWGEIIKCALWIILNHDGHDKFHVWCCPTFSHKILAESYDTQLSFGLSGNHFGASYEASEFC